MHHRTLALALALVTALLGTAALPALGQESPAPSATTADDSNAPCTPPPPIEDSGEQPPPPPPPLEDQEVVVPPIEDSGEQPPPPPPPLEDQEVVVPPIEDSGEQPPPPPPPLEDQEVVVPPCTYHYQATSIPGVRTWKGACIDTLDRGPIVLEWKDTSPGRTIKGVFTLDPSSETEGTLTWESTGKGPGWSLKNRAQGTYRIEVSGTNDDGSPSELLVVHSTKGTVRTCAGGRCTTKKADLGEGTIPLDVLSGKCPVTP